MRHANGTTAAFHLDHAAVRVIANPVGIDSLATAAIDVATAIKTTVNSVVPTVTARAFLDEIGNAVVDLQGDDEDGVAVGNIFVPADAALGYEIPIEVVASADGFLDAWIDFNRNMQFDNNEKLVTSSVLSNPINNLATTTLLNVQDASRFTLPLPFDVRIDSEEVQVTGISGNQLTVTRGVNGTTRAAHLQNAVVRSLASASIPVVAGLNRLSIDPRAYTTTIGFVEGDSFARFRISPSGGLFPTGLGIGGEVEDYFVRVLDNAAPTVANLPAPALVFDEDDASVLLNLLDVDAGAGLQPLFDDVDLHNGNEDLLTYRLLSNSNPTLLTATLFGTDLRFEFHDDQNDHRGGAAAIVIEATDHAGLTETVTLTVTVTPVNDAPVLNRTPSRLVIDEGTNTVPPGGPATTPLALATSLDGAVLANALSLTVQSAAALPRLVPFYVQLGAEQLRVTQVDGNRLTLASPLVGAHADGANVTASPLAVTDVDAAELMQTRSVTALAVASVSGTLASLTVQSVLGLPVATPFDIRVGSEDLRVTAVVGNALSVLRGANGTPMPAHLAGEWVGLLTNGLALPAALGAVTPVTTVSVADASSFVQATPFNIFIENEELRVTSIAGNDFTVVRGINGTLPAQHLTTALVTDGSGGSSTPSSVVNVNTATLTFTNIADAATPNLKQFPNAPFQIRIEDELLVVTNIVRTPGAGTTTDVWTVLRGVNGTTGAAHAATTTLVEFPGLTDLVVNLSVGDLDGVNGNDGQLNLQAIGRAVVMNNATDKVTIQGPEADVNATLAGMTYTAPSAEFNRLNNRDAALNPTGDVFVTVNVTDLGNTGSSDPPPVVLPQILTITVNPVNDAPVVTATPGAFTMDEGVNGGSVPLAMQDLRTVVVTDVDLPELFGAQLVTGLTAAPGSVEIQIAASGMHLFPTAFPFFVQIGTEDFQVTGLAVASPTDTFTANRAANGTMAAPHAIGDFVNNLSVGSTLNAPGGLAAATTMLVVGDASAFPATAPFKIRIADEELEVTGISGTTFTVVRGVNGSTAPALHADGIFVVAPGPTEVLVTVTVNADDDTANGTVSIPTPGARTS